ncbi:Trypsin domain containing protein [Asbolus verrucosus]|uniref:Trypsin domain containing protein n=1 Tax=Asbolus verrucosus TaxID=1661398 RepID=A0A482VE19_ASBVE|nr:Trypsin domain containing protein [Asbolus verrucosus]
MNDVKQKAKFGHKKKNECFVSINLTENQLCAGSTANAKTCPGDSGGPLMKISTIGEVDRAFLIGVVSLGTDCNRNLQIAVFTKISAYISRNIGIHGSNFVVVLGFNSIRSNAATLSTENKCIPLEDCPQVVDLIDTKGTHFGTKNLLRMLHCRNRDRQAYIKCVSQSKITEYLEKAELLPSPEGCGLVDLHEKISGGEATDLDEYPWIALLKYRNQAGKINYGCHANLISKKYVVTAAHCVDRSSPSIKEELIGNVYSVILGEYDIRNVTDCIYHAYGDDCADEVKEFLVQSYKVHPEYVASSKVNDIALVRLQGEVEFSDFIKPVCLPPNALRLNHSETWWVGGWGETADCKLDYRLQF